MSEYDISYLNYRYTTDESQVLLILASHFFTLENRARNSTGNATDDKHAYVYT